jgi:hypothetical protein
MSDLIPKHKSDFETIEKLKTKTFNDIKPILPQLLEW